MASSRSGRFDDELPELRAAFRQAMRETRLTLGLTQQQLAERLGVTQGAVSAWEVGETTPSPQGVFALERAMDLPAGFLAGYLGYGPPRGHEPRSPDVVEAILRDPLLPPEFRSSLIALYRQIAERFSEG